jgi:hypothetical protein
MSDDGASRHNRAAADADAGQDRDSCADPGAGSHLHRLCLQFARASLGGADVVGVGEQQHLLPEADAVADFDGGVDIEPAADIEPAGAPDFQVALYVAAAGKGWLAAKDSAGADPNARASEKGRPDSSASFVG